MESIIIFFGTKGHLIVIGGALLALVLVTVEQRVALFYKALIALPVAFLAGRSLSLVIDSPRPFVVENITPLIDHIADNGFPSEHTLLVATIALLVYTEHKALGILLAITAITVGFARILANVHHGIDVAGSITIAFISVTFAHIGVTWLQKRYAGTLPLFR
jgi:undecaprenyl-diphosphatase